VPQRGDTVRVTLRRVGERWDVQRAEVRDQPTKLGGYVELRGSVTGIDWNVRPLELTLRGVRVAISDDVLTSSGCSGAGPLSLEIVAARGRLPLRALALSCSLPPPGN
jgi:hypothetical protein